jgi:hypothetical protein
MQRLLTPLLWLCILSLLNPQRPLYEQVAVAVIISEFSLRNVYTSLYRPEQQLQLLFLLNVDYSNRHTRCSL